ncbi:MAG: two-component sensor histidine kinase [Paenibacillaceae bacterium]|nr:two-component sensor histidine kinase [Paenibacillaceae bacterium]
MRGTKWLSGLSFKLFLLCLLFVSGVVTGVTRLAYTYIYQELRSNNEFYVRQMLSKVDQYLTLSSSSILSQLYAVNSYYTPGTALENLKPLMNQLLEMNQGLIKNIYVIRPDLSIIGGSPLTVVYEDPREERRVFYEQALADRAGVSYTGPYASSSSGWTVTMSKLLKGSDPPAVIALDLDLSLFESTLLDLSRSDLINMAIMDSSGKVIAAFPTQYGKFDHGTHTTVIGGITSAELARSGEASLTTKNEEGKPLSILKLSASRFEWSIISVNDETRLAEPLRRLNTYYWVLLLAGLFLSAGVAWVVTRYIRKPLRFLRTQMTMVKQGNMTAGTALKRRDEFGELSRTFNQMIRRIADLLQDREEDYEKRRQLEIQVLQSQINPHFLYNTLGSISNVIGLGQYDKADPIIVALIRILEYGIADAAQKVTLEEEIRNVRDFIYIQNTRYNKEFPLIEEIEPELYSFPVFRMLLQPIVENSLFHGYCGGRMQGEVRIRAFREEQRTVVEVVDHGVGMAPETAQMLLTLEKKHEGTRRRIGLRNIHQRIQLYYGLQYGLTIASIPGGGTCVRAEFP